MLGEFCTSVDSAPRWRKRKWGSLTWLLEENTKHKKAMFSFHPLYKNDSWLAALPVFFLLTNPLCLKCISSPMPWNSLRCSDAALPCGQPCICMDCCKTESKTPPYQWLMSNVVAPTQRGHNYYCVAEIRLPILLPPQLHTTMAIAALQWTSRHHSM